MIAAAAEHLLQWSSSRCSAARVAQTRSLRWSSSKAGSSGRYLARQKKDHFVRSRDEQNYVARSAFKLKELDDSFRFLRQSHRVVDLGASPGGWTQVVCERMTSGGHVLAVDLLAIDPQITSTKSARSIKVEFYRGDFTSPDFVRHFLAMVKSAGTEEERANVDVVLSDMMVNTSGNTIRDAEGALQLYTSVHTFARQVLARQGWLVMKYFDSPEAQNFRKSVLENSFIKVFAKKPEASRKESSEMYWICRDLKGP